MKLGSKVKLTYKGYLEDGTVFGKADETSPLVFQTGMDVVITGLENGILEMNEAGEKKTIEVSMYDAYGEYLEDNIQFIPQEVIPRTLAVGQRVPMTNDDGETFIATVLAIENGKVKFDMNHPLAGKNLIFDVELLEVEDAPDGFIPAAERRKMMEENQPSPVPFNQM